MTNDSPLDSLIKKTYAEIPWTNFLGIFRSLLAFSTLLTLSFNNIYILSHKLYVGNQGNYLPDMEKIGLFTLFQNDLPLAKAIGIVILLLVILGIYPRVTAILHWWVCFSITSGLTIVDGGEQVSTVITFLLLPVLITDSRKSHWQLFTGKAGCTRLAIANLGISVIKLQIAYLYFHAFVSKLNVPEWVDGSVLHYWFTDSMLGMSAPVYNTIGKLIDYNDYIIFICTWSVLLLELSISLSIFNKNQSIRKIILVAGIFFHALIAIFFGITSFGLTMIAVVYFYLGQNRHYSALNPFTGLETAALKA